MNKSVNSIDVEIMNNSLNQTPEANKKVNNNKFLIQLNISLFGKF